MSKGAPDPLVECFAKFRRDLRQLLYEYGVRSNPGWTEENIVQALRKILEAKVDLIIKNSKTE